MRAERRGSTEVMAGPPQARRACCNILLSLLCCAVLCCAVLCCVVLCCAVSQQSRQLGRVHGWRGRSSQERPAKANGASHLHSA